LAKADRLHNDKIIKNNGSVINNLKIKS